MSLIRVTIVKSQATPVEQAEGQEQNDFKEISRSALIIPEQTKSSAEKVEKTVPERDITDDQRDVQDESRISENEENLEKAVDAVACDADALVNAYIFPTTMDCHVQKSDEIKDSVSEKFTAQDVSLNAELRETHELQGREQEAIKNDINLKKENEKHVTMEGSDVILNHCGSAPPEKDRNGQIFVMIKENVQSLPIDAIKIEQLPISNQQYATQYCNVRVPILTYQNVPIQISPQIQSQGNLITRLPDAIGSENVENENHSLLKNDQCFKKISNDANVIENMDNDRQYKHGAQNSNSEGSMCKMSNFYRLNHNTDVISCRSTAEMDRVRQGASREETLQVHDNQGTYGSVSVARRELKSEECLGHARSSTIGKPCRVSESRISTKRRKVSTMRSKKAKSFFQKKCQSTVRDSDCTLIWPGYQRIKQKHSQYYLHKIIGQRGDRCHGMKQYAEKKKKKKKRSKTGSCVSLSRAPNSKKALYAKFYRDSLRRNTGSESEEDFKRATGKVADSPTSNTEELVEHPTTIPFETQQLLNKSYWEYYNKLRNRIDAKGNLEEKCSGLISMGAPQLKRRKNDNMKNFESHAKLSLPEIRTLEQCTVLSSMINKTLDTAIPRSADTSQTKQLYLNGNIKSSSDPTAGTRSAIVRKIPLKMPKRIYDESLLSTSVNNKNKYIEETVDNHLLNLKTVVFFGSVMYILIVFLPMIYDYLFFEEYDDYEDLGYAELAIEYVLSSFQEAFGGIFDVIGKIFFPAVSWDYGLVNS